jgi:hypothetical protein
VTSYLMEATVGWSFFYSLLLVLLGWFLLSLVLAVIGDKYVEAVGEEEEEAKARAKKEEEQEEQQEREEQEEQAAGQQQQPGGGSGKGTRGPAPNPLVRAWGCIAGPFVACWRAPLPGPLGRSKEWRLRRWTKVRRTDASCRTRLMLPPAANYLLPAVKSLSAWQHSVS